jgi:FkbM family methyltransferase
MSQAQKQDKFWSNLIEGAKKRTKKTLYSPYRIFNINWFQEKYYKHASKAKDYKHTYNGKEIMFTDPQAFLLSVRELFIEEIYSFKTNNPGPVIIDCGAHIGMSILFFKNLYPDASIIAFEPDTHNYGLTKKNLENWKYNNVELIKKAVWINNGTIQFNQLNDMGSSIVEGGTTIAGDVVSVECVRLRDYLENKVDFLKLDIEGAEFAVINDCMDKLQNVENLFIEYHGKFEEMDKLNSILNIVVSQGFAYYIKEAGNLYNKPFVDFLTRNKIDYDVQLNIFCFRISKS